MIAFYIILIACFYHCCSNMNSNVAERIVYVHKETIMVSWKLVLMEI
jgi:hypothetical protein